MVEIYKQGTIKKCLKCNWEFSYAPIIGIAEVVLR